LSDNIVTVLATFTKKESPEFNRFADSIISKLSILCMQLSFKIHDKQVLKLYYYTFLCIVISFIGGLQLGCIVKQTFNYQRLHVVFRKKVTPWQFEKTFTNCTLENTFAMLDTTIREVNLEKLEREK
jgi:hypothetical protein